MSKISFPAKTQWLLITGIIVVIAVFALVRSSQSPTVISATVSPELIVKGQSQEVKVIVVVKPNPFPAPKLKAVMVGQGYKNGPTEQSYKINTNVDKDWIKYFSVFQLNPKTLGYLKETGKDSQGNLLYTGTFTINNTSAQTVQIQPTNIFGMNLLADTKPLLSRLAITNRLTSFPPDPAEAGKATLEGIDSDSDGLRDDVQREIMFLAPESGRKREALRQYAKAELYLSTAKLANQGSAVKAGQDSFRAMACLELDFDHASFSAIYEQYGLENVLDNLVTNTAQRSGVHTSNTSKKLTGAYPSGPSSKDPKVICDIDPGSLPD